MTVAVDAGLRKGVLADLARLVSPDVWSIDNSGFVHVKPSLRPNAAESLLDALAKAPGWSVSLARRAESGSTLAL